MLQAELSEPQTRPAGGRRRPSSFPHDAVAALLRRAGKRVAPVWPLANFVAVNPYLGMTEMTIGQVEARLARLAGARTTMPLAHYRDLLAQQRITPRDVAAALHEHGHPLADDVEAFLSDLSEDDSQSRHGQHLPTVADAASQLTGRDWRRLADERIAAWAAAYFDEGTAQWTTCNRGESLYASWKAEASIDRTPGVLGLSGFRAEVRSLPDDPLEAARLALDELSIPPKARELYLQRLLLRVGGWSAFVARLVWERELRGEQDESLRDFQAVLLAWELALSRSLPHPEWSAAWTTALAAMAATAGEMRSLGAASKTLILQTAWDRAEQRRMLRKLAAPAAVAADRAARPGVQAVFCIDVRSEVFRRHLEAVNAGVETLGFAGFFGFPLAYVPIGHRRARAQCPVLLTPRHVILESLPDDSAQQRAVRRRTLKHHVGRAWYAFKMGAISCFSFVGPVGLAYLPRLATDALGFSRPVQHPEAEGLTREMIAAKGPRLAPEQHGDEATGLRLDARIELAESALRAMSLTSGFAPLVMLVGHGATTVNNPHATGLDCGACGGHAGEANARVAAAVLNDPAVREALRPRGVQIPADTVFLACQHDTTTDKVTIFHRDEVPPSHAARLQDLEQWLAEAGRRARAERGLRLGVASGSDADKAVTARSRDWSQVRPEWGLAGCSSMVVAPRSRTREVDLQGRTFLHSYDWKQDPDFSVLELIMTAPLVVASWINLQYYGSTVDNRLFGSGNKTLHNVVGKVGVLEGNAGDLRVGLPWQSVHDGRRLQHEPLRLSVVIEAPRDAVQAVLQKHEAVRNLVGNGWVFLTVVDNEQWFLWSEGGRWREFSPKEREEQLASPAA